MEIKGGGRASWVRALATERLTQLPAAPEPEQGPRLSPAQTRALGQKVEHLTGLLVPEKLAKAHAPSLKHAAAELGRLAEVHHHLEGWRQKSFARVLGQFHKTLGAALELAPEASRPALAKAATKAMVGLVQQVGTGASLSPAVSAAVSLFDTELRLSAQKRLALDPAELGLRFAGAANSAGALANALVGRTGVGTSLNLLPSLVEQLARRRPAITAAELGAEVQATARFLVEVGPRSGLDQVGASRLSRSFAAALAGQGAAEVGPIFAEARRLFLAEYQAGHQDLLRQIADPVPRLEGDVDAKGVLLAARQALTRLVEAHPAASPGLESAVYSFRAALVQSLQAHGAGQALPQHQALVALIDVHGRGPLAEAMLRFGENLLPRLHLYADRPASLGRAAQAQTPAGTAAALLELMFGEGLDPVAKRQLTQLGKREGVAVLELVLALDPAEVGRRGTSALALIKDVDRWAERGGHEDGVRGAASYFSRANALDQALAGRGPWRKDAEQRWALAASLAESKPHLAEGGAFAAAQLLLVVPRYFKHVDLLSLGPDANERRGLMSATDPTLKWKAPMPEVLGRLLSALKQAGVTDKKGAALDQAVARAIDFAFVVGRMDGQYKVPFERIAADFQMAYAAPKKLRWAASAGEGELRAKPNVEAFLTAHQVLPRELALTAGLHLSRPQLEWLMAKVSGMTGRDTVRRLRDFIFACVTAGRLDLLDAIRGEGVPPKIVQAVIEAVSFQYREGHLRRIKFDRMIEGLAKGEDPTKAIEAERLGGALAELKLVGPIDPQGAAALERCAVAIKNLMEYTRPGKVVDEIDMGVMKKPFLSVLQSVADGSWPAAKYDVPLAAEVFKGLTPQQIEIWRNPTVVEAGGGKAPARPVEIEAAPGAIDPRFKEARVWVKGLAAALEKIKLKHPKLGALAHDRATEKALQKELSGQIEVLRNGEKGSRRHQAAVKAIRATRDLLGLLSLELALKRAKGEPRAMMAKLKPYLEDGLDGLRSRHFEPGVNVAADLLALADLVHVKPAAAPAPGQRAGTYALDEDNLEALLMATTGGCIHHANVRRWANINLAANPHEKIARTHEGGQFKYRACLKLVEAKFAGYQGPVIWMNDPNSNAGGTEAHKELMIRAVLTKGRQMKIPVVTAGWHGFGNAPARMGVKAKQLQATVTFPDGATGSTFTDYHLPHNLKKARGNAARYSGAQQLQIVMPN